MGSFGADHWSQCYWCQWWQQGDVYIIDWIGRPLCDRCYDWHTDFGGGPYQPDAIVRATKHITGVLRLPVSGNLVRHVAEYLHAWYEP